MCFAHYMCFEKSLLYLNEMTFHMLNADADYCFNFIVYGIIEY